MSNERLPFMDGTARKIAWVTSRNFSEGKKLEPIKLPAVGFLARIILVFEGIMNIPSSGVVTKPYGLWALLENISVKTNINATELFDMSGWDAFIDSHFIERGYDAEIESNGAGGVLPDQQAFFQSINVGNNTVRFVLPIQINANMGMDAISGLIHLQAEGVECNLVLKCGKGADVFGGGGGVTISSGEFQVYYEYFETPDPNVYEYPPLQVVRRIASQKSVVLVGDNTYDVPAEGHLVRMIHGVEISDALATSQIESIRTKLNGTETNWEEDYRINRMRSRMSLGNVLPNGVVNLDYWHAYNMVSQGSFRDVIDTQAVSEFKSIIKVKSGSVLGADGTNRIRTIRTIVQPLQVAAPA